MDPQTPHPLDQQVAATLRGDFAEGWRIAELLEATAPDDPRAKFNRAWYEMRRGNLLEGLRLLDHGRWVNAFGDKPLPTDRPIYRDEDLRGRHVLLCSEGGLGDEIINARFARHFAERGAKVVLTSDPSLRSAFARIQGVAAVINHKAAPEVHHDYWVPGMSAARILNIENHSLSGRPYLSPDPAYVAKWRPVVDAHFGSSAPRLGLRFYGNPEFEHEQHRRFPARDLVTALGGRPWINLQKEETKLDLRTWEDTLAVLSLLDLVITSCTSVAHAAAALGRETWIIVPIMPYYIWALPGERSPWYDTARLFRQTKFGEWSDVFEEIKIALEDRCTTRPNSN